MSTPIQLVGTDGTLLNARVEVEPRGIILHSRSGVDRNRDYREALQLLMARLDAAAVAYDIYLDSARVQHLPIEQRKLAFPRLASFEDQFRALVKAMNHGSSSNGAWRRLLIAPDRASSDLVAILEDRRRPEGDAVRLPTSQLRRVTPAHIDAAVARLTAGKDASNFAPSRDFDLLTPAGARLAPKKVFGLALEEALGTEARPEHFSAGIGTPCFQLLEAAGYPIVRKGEPIAGNLLEPVDPDMAAAEGRPKLVAHLRRERNPALAAAKRRAMVEQLGHLKCERCDLRPSGVLGPQGDAVIEVHHDATRVADMGAEHVTRLSDLRCLCANCHRIVHREIAAERP